MDAEGWIPISLLANFNRVKKLTTDSAIVREVLSLSSIVEVRADHVRMRDDQWRAFVLPDVRESTRATETASTTLAAHHEGGDEEEEGLEIVTGPEAGQPWVPSLH
jgi:la-related protein 1